MGRKIEAAVKVIEDRKTSWKDVEAAMAEAGWVVAGNRVKVYTRGAVSIWFSGYAPATPWRAADLVEGPDGVDRYRRHRSYRSLAAALAAEEAR